MSRTQQAHGEDGREAIAGADGAGTTSGPSCCSGWVSRLDSRLPPVIADYAKAELDIFNVVLLLLELFRGSRE
jgi:hypothetical protein